MPNQKIELEKGDPVTGKITLSDHGRTDVNSNWDFRKVKWEIKNPNTNIIKSFLIKGKTADNPFEQPIPTSYGTKVSLDVSEGVEIDWEYSIYWKDTPTHIAPPYDPLISIKPTKKKHRKNEFLIPLLVAAFIGFVGITLFLGNKKKNSK